MARTRDYYDVLGVQRDADEKAIKSAFRKLALRYHPDRNKEQGAAERFKEIAEAYAVLSDPRKRKEYDARGHDGVSHFTHDDLFGDIDLEDIFGGLGLDLGGGGLFRRFFGRGGGVRRGANLELDLVVPLELVLTGGDQRVSVTRPAACPECGGTGAKPGTSPETCGSCGGTGRRAIQERRGTVTVQHVSVCQECGGRGNIITDPCAACSGSAEVTREEVLKVRIPAGIEENTVLRVPGHGLPSRVEGGRPGDLYITVRTTPDARFRRRGEDLWRDETLNITDLVLGASVRVAPLDGDVTVKIPPGTQPGAALRLRGKGLPAFHGKGHGDLFVRVRAHLPEKLSPEERRLYDRLRSLARGDA